VGLQPEPIPSADELRIRADTQGGEKGHYFFEGFVDLHKGDIQIQADRLDLYELERPEGGMTRKVVAQGNVVFAQGEERLSGDRMTMDVDSGEGTFEEAYGYLQPGIYIEAKVIERVDPQTYRVVSGRFTSCGQPNARWSFKASSAKVMLNNKIVAKNFVFDVKDAPIFYFPYFVYPISEDNRATGFMIPHFSVSSIKGTNFGDEFFWAINRSVDTTFYFDHYQLFDEGYGNEFRYVGNSGNAGYFREYGIKPGPGEPWDWDVDWHAIQLLPFGAKASVIVRRYSNILFERTIQETINFATTRTERASLQVTDSFGPLALNFLTDSVETFSSSDAGTQSLKQRHLPSLDVVRSAQAVGPTRFVWGVEGHVANLEQGNQDQIYNYPRADIAPWLSYPFTWAFLQVTPKVTVRYTHYGDTIDPNTGFSAGGAIDRRYFESSVSVLGPSFARVFNNPSGFFSDKIKHVIGPEITWQYRTYIDNFNEIPKFDGLDQYVGTNQINYALVQHFFKKRSPTPGAKPVPFEFLNWRVGQTYYAQIANNQNSFDPNYASAYFGPGGVPSHNSPVQSQLSLKPSPVFTGTFNVEYDVNFNQLRDLSAVAQVNQPWGVFSAGLSKAENVAVNPAQRTPTLNTVREGGTFHLVPNVLDLNASVVYDILNKNLIEVGGKVHYHMQCCGVLFEYLRYDINGTVDSLVRFSFELTNVGGIGTFFGQDPTKLYPGLLSYR
jgi:LPS-assembly protein